MYKKLQFSFRKDLIITQINKKDSLTKHYLVKDPISGESFEFGEEEYFLCQAMNGILTNSEILAAFKNSFGLSMTEEDFNQFSGQIASFGLLESLSGQVASPSTGNIYDSSDETIAGSTGIEREKLKANSQAKRNQNKKSKKYIWFLPNSGSTFALLTEIIKPFRVIFTILLWLLIPAVPIAFLTLINNQSILWQELSSLEELFPFLLTYFFDVSIGSLTARVVQGVVFTYCGGKVEKFGIVPALGFYPHFHVEKKNIWQLKRSAQLWTFASPLIVRLTFFVLGTFIWIWNRGTGTDLTKWSLILAHASFFVFLMEACPLWPVDGYMFMVAYFRLPPSFLKRVYLVWDMMLNRRPKPASLSFRSQLLLLVYGLAVIVFWLSMTIIFAYNTAIALASNFSGIFGLATGAIIVCFFLGLALRQPLGMLFKSKQLKSTSVQSPVVEEYVLTPQSFTSPKKKKSWSGNLLKVIFIVAICVLLFWPYPYRPGGQIQLLPPTQQQIQAPVDGKIVKVYFKGGDTTWIKTGTLIALMEASDIENNTLKTEEQIKTQQAVLEKDQANLNKLLNTPRKEEVELAQKEVEVAKQQVEVVRQDIEVAKQEVEVAMRQLDATISKAKFSFDEASRYQYLSQEGAVSRQRFEDKQKSAETERINVEESRKNLLVKQNEVQSKRNQLISSKTSVQQKEANLKLVMSGAHPDDIAASRKQVEAARAELKRLEQELKYNKDQLQRTQLLMPIDGYLVTPYLDQKVGSYLKQGDTFAVTEDDRHIRGEAKVPEYNAGEFAIGAQVEVKLAAYPDVSFIGKVIAIEPTAASESSPVSSTGDHSSTNSNDRIIRVIVDLPNIDRVLKAGLTGYAKIDGSEKPVIVAFTRPIVRYIQLEVWSWLP